MYGHYAEAKTNFIDRFSPALERDKEKINVKEVFSEAAGRQQLPA